MDWLGNNVKTFKVKGITIIANRNNGMVIGLDREGEEVVDLLKSNLIEISSLSDNQKELYKVLEENDFLKSCYKEIKGIDSVYLHVNSACNLHCLGSYTASVESMIPAIGWGYIKQDFTANVSSSRISSVSLVGSSYDTGFTLGSWEPNYSWTDISSNKQFVQIHMKGTINYLWEGLNISKDCTFLDTFKASGSSLVESSYLDWPD